MVITQLKTAADAQTGNRQESELHTAEQTPQHKGKQQVKGNR